MKEDESLLEVDCLEVRDNELFQVSLKDKFRSANTARFVKFVDRQFPLPLVGTFRLVGTCIDDLLTPLGRD